VTIDEAARELTPEQLRELSMRFMLGCAVGELYNLGLAEEEIRFAFEQSLAALKQHRRPTS
jgi:hypothetical protein